MYATFIKNKVKLYDDTGFIIRQYNIKGNVLQVNVSGNSSKGTVMIIDDHGYTTLYDTTGAIIRRTRINR